MKMNLIDITKKVLPSIIIPFVLLGFIEALLASLYLLTSSKYFESFNKTLERSGKLKKSPEKNLRLKSELNSNKKKIAIFGGSSSAGYAASKSFSTFLKDTLKGEYIIHNYAQPGASFYGNQADIIKETIPYYDTLIIYSGHNEVWNQIYYKAIKSKTGYKMPNKDFISKRKALGSIMQTKRRIQLVKNSVNDITPIINKSQFLGRLVLPNLIIKTGKEINNNLNKAINNNLSIKEIDNRYPFFADKKIISLLEREVMLKNFKDEIEKIIPLLEKHQKLIISTVLSNDLYPPILDFSNSSKIDNIKHNYNSKNLYGNLITKKPISLEETNKLPSGAHRKYLNSLISCDLIPFNLANEYLNQNCIEKLKFARGADQLPFRVIPEINKHILSLKGLYPNVYIINPVSNVNKSKTTSEYLSYFVDFQHPSTKGHALLSEEIIKILSPSLEAKFNLISKCDSYQITTTNDNKTYKINSHDLQRSLNINIKWLISQINVSSTPIMNKWYLESAIDKREKCI